MAIDFEQDVASFGVPTDDEIKNISALAEKQSKIEEWIERQEQKIKEAKGELQKIRTEQLPDAMKTAGVEELKLADGSKVSIKEDVRTTITKANQDEAFAWLTENGYGDIIRNEFKVSFGKGEDLDANKFAEFLTSDLEHDYTGKRYVHHSTLPAFVRRYMAEGKADDYFMRLFSVFVQRIADVERS